MTRFPLARVSIGTRLPWLDMIGACSQLALGCAQLGMGYGVANTTGQPTRAAASEIVGACWEHGVRFFDTAQAYGESEIVLGDCLRAHNIADQACVISKLAPDVATIPDRVHLSVETSLKRLGLKSLWGLLLHDQRQLDSWDDGLGAAMRALKCEGLVAHLGISVYSPDAALRALEHPDVDVIQVPGGVFDRRALRLGVLKTAETLGKTVFTRSVYLQGLALMDADRLPDGMGFATEAVVALREFCFYHGVTREQFALHYARDRFPSSVLVVGAETADQAVANCRLMSAAASHEDLYRAWDERWPDDVEGLVDPSRWRPAT